MTFHYWTNCVNIPSINIDELSIMIDSSIDITRKTFLKYVDREELSILSQNMGYSDHYRHGLTMAGDYHVSYHKGTIMQKVCYFFTHSAIEYMFLKVDN